MFPGQGSQFVGMAKDLYFKFAASQRVLDAAESHIGVPLKQMMFDGPQDALTQTQIAQAALISHSCAVLAAVKQASGRNANEYANAVIGHSLGEYSGLVAADVLSFEVAVKIAVCFARSRFHPRVSLTHHSANVALQWRRVAVGR
jgi:[acyl-carrier-protein] S-malonyltransferase